MGNRIPNPNSRLENIPPLKRVMSKVFQPGGEALLILKDFLFRSWGRKLSITALIASLIVSPIICCCFLTESLALSSQPSCHQSTPSQDHATRKEGDTSDQSHCDCPLFMSDLASQLRWQESMMIAQSLLKTFLAEAANPMPFIATNPLVKLKKSGGSSPYFHPISLRNPVLRI